jgi:O-antigen ligase
MYNPSLGNNNYSNLTNRWKKASEQWRYYLTTANAIGLLGAIVTLYCLLALPQLQYWNFRATLYLIIIIWTILRPRLALYLLPLSIAWGSMDTIGANITLTDILVASLVVSWLMGFLLHPFIAARGTRNAGPLDREPFNVPLPLTLSMGTLLFTMLLSTTVTTNLTDSIKEIIKWSEALAIVLLGTHYLRTQRHVWTLLIMIFLAGLSQAIFGYAQFLFDLGPTSFIRDTSLRVYGTFGQPNPYAGYINTILSIALALSLLGSELKTRILSLCIVFPLATVEVLAQSKGAWLAIIVATLLILFLGLPRLRVLAHLGLIALLAIIALYLAGNFPFASIQPILKKIGVIDISFTNPTPDNYANSERLAHWLAGIHMFLDHPLTGVGIGNFQDLYAQYSLGIFVLPLGHAHNYYINIAAEAGILGLLALLFFLTTLFIYSGHVYYVIHKPYQQLLRRLQRLPSATPPAQRQQLFKDFHVLTNARAITIGLIAALLSICVHNVVDNLYVHAMTGFFALLIALLIRIKSITLAAYDLTRSEASSIISVQVNDVQTIPNQNSTSKKRP